MGLESATYISDLVSTNPASGDAKSQGDDHIRLVKATVKATFPNVSGAVTATHTELNYTDGVTSNIQTQLDSKSSATGDTYTGDHDFTGATVTVATPVANSNPVPKSYADALAFSAALPGQGGNSGKFVTTDGTNASWANIFTGRTYTAPLYTRDDDGNISGGTWAIDYANGPVIKATATAAITSITMSNWPASGTAGHLRLMLSAGAYSITFPAWKWIKSDLTTTTTFADLGLTLPSANPAIIDLFSDDGGTTMYATVGRN